MTRQRTPVIVSIALFALLGLDLGQPPRLQAEPPIAIEIGSFTSKTPDGPWPDGWKPLTFPKIPQHTTYRLVKDGDRGQE